MRVLPKPSLTHGGVWGVKSLGFEEPVVGCKFEPRTAKLLNQSWSFHGESRLCLAQGPSGKSSDLRVDRVFCIYRKSAVD